MDNLNSANKKLESVVFGQRAEQAAHIFLEKKGLKFLEKNYRCPGGEIDLIMMDGEYYVFIEVRKRQDAGMGSSLESITPQKQHRIVKSALHYLQKHHLIDHVDCRFDVVAIDGKNLAWIQNAFHTK